MNNKTKMFKPIIKENQRNIIDNVAKSESIKLNSPLKKDEDLPVNKPHIESIKTNEEREAIVRELSDTMIAKGKSAVEAVKNQIEIFNMLYTKGGGWKGLKESIGSDQGKELDAATYKEIKNDLSEKAIVVKTTISPLNWLSKEYIWLVEHPLIIISGIISIYILGKIIFFYIKTCIIKNVNKKN